MLSFLVGEVKNHYTIPVNIIIERRVTVYFHITLSKGILDSKDGFRQILKIFIFSYYPKKVMLIYPKI
jgi:hypothetical protein